VVVTRGDPWGSSLAMKKKIRTQNYDVITRRGRNVWISEDVTCMYIVRYTYVCICIYICMIRIYIRMYYFINFKKIND
jgi:hypothetical protein